MRSTRARELLNAVKTIGSRVRLEIGKTSKMMATRSRSRERIDVRVPEHASNRQQRELGAFARYCILRVERELGQRQAWIVELGLSLRGYSSRISVDHGGVVLEEIGTGSDGALATWDAMCRIEQRLREQRW
jgi:hypothetical protein